MTKVLYMFAMFVAIVTLIITIINGISFFTCIVRSAFVFLGILFTFFIAGQLLKYGILLNSQKPKVKDKE